jgi:hypothetical protein
VCELTGFTPFLRGLCPGSHRWHVLLSGIEWHVWSRR